MTLTGIISNSASPLNKKLLVHASKNTPCLIIDCANCANPHALYPEASLQQLSQIYVVELELIYKFRDILLRVPSILRQIKSNLVIVTTSEHLFNYQDEIENNNILNHAWQLMRSISKNNKVIVALKPGKHEKFARRYCDGTYSFEPKNGD